MLYMFLLSHGYIKSTVFLEIRKTKPSKLIMLSKLNYLTVNLIYISLTNEFKFNSQTDRTVVWKYLRNSRVIKTLLDHKWVYI